MELPVATGARTHRGSNSKQLFVLLEVEEAEAVPEAPVPVAEEAGRYPAWLGRTAWRCGRVALLGAGATALACCLALAAAAGPRPGGQLPSGLAAPQQKSVVIGSARLPGGLLPAPHAEVVMMGHPAYHCSYSMSPRCPARELFSNPELLEVATENLMQVGHGILVHADRDRVRADVAAGFKNLSLALDERAPEVARELAQIELDEQQKNAVLSALRLVGLPEVQRVGFEVALALRRSLSTRTETVRTHVEEMLASNLGELQRLRQKVVPESVLGLWAKARPWELTLEPENLRVVEAFHGGKLFGSMNTSFYKDAMPKTPKKLPLKEKAYAAWGGVVEESRAFMGIIKLIARSAGRELDVPAWATSLHDNIDVKDLGSELLSCELHDHSGMNNFMKAIFCPLKYGSQGADALRAVGHMARTEGSAV